MVEFRECSDGIRVLSLDSVNSGRLCTSLWVDFLSFHDSELGKTVRHRMIVESVFEISPKVSPGVSDYRREYW